MSLRTIVTRVSSALRAFAESWTRNGKPAVIWTVEHRCWLGDTGFGMDCTQLYFATSLARAIELMKTKEGAPMSEGWYAIFPSLIDCTMNQEFKWAVKMPEILTNEGHHMQLFFFDLDGNPIELQLERPYDSLAKEG